MIAACVKHKARRLVYVSTYVSTSVYEPLPDGLVDDETRDGDRGWVYTRTKLDMGSEASRAVRQQNLLGDKFIYSGFVPVRCGEFYDGTASASGMAKPGYWPAECVSRANQGLMCDIQLLTPKRTAAKMRDSRPERPDAPADRAHAG